MKSEMADLSHVRMYVRPGGGGMVAVNRHRPRSSPAQVVGFCSRLLRRRVVHLLRRVCAYIMITTSQDSFVLDHAKLAVVFVVDADEREQLCHT